MLLGLSRPPARNGDRPTGPRGYRGPSCTKPARPRSRPARSMMTLSPSTSWGDDTSSGGPFVTRRWSVSCSKASISRLTLGLSRAHQCNSNHHLCNRLSARWWSRDALNAVKTSASRMCSLICFPHFDRDSGVGTICPCPAPRAAIAVQSVEGLRLRAALSLAWSDLEMKRRFGTGGPWVCDDGVHRTRGTCAASCQQPAVCARRSRPPRATPRFALGVNSTPSSESYPSSSVSTMMITGELEASGPLRRLRAPLSQS